MDNLHIVLIILSSSLLGLMIAAIIYNNRKDREKKEIKVEIPDDLTQIDVLEFVKSDAVKIEAPKPGIKSKINSYFLIPLKLMIKPLYYLFTLIAFIILVYNPDFKDIIIYIFNLILAFILIILLINVSLAIIFGHSLDYYLVKFNNFCLKLRNNAYRR